jgi:hypothetical protein
MDKDTHHGQRHASWTRTRTMDKGMQHGHGMHRGQDMGTEMDIDSYHTGALGPNYAKIRKYVYMNIVITIFHLITKFRNL